MEKSGRARTKGTRMTQITRIRVDDDRVGAVVHTTLPVKTTKKSGGEKEQSNILLETIL